ncbi:head completion/stabilization protein [Pantoea agglomerans]|uniref:head completion/stabilization protein n=1 Tax=Enterobacter agglomerans TaxID=549 RepID=UPI0013B77A8D|nr:head completion/stabilization protein [Pantoea agglomerans]NEG85467.1 head completion/stabilization protein [Pantoea agglomerans]NEH07414.1 head completion/stabilization protein [Pantoea agglomerans]
MEFIAPQKATGTPDIIPNNSFWPDVDLAKFRSVMRVDGTVTPERLRQVVLTAMAEVNAELYPWRERQELAGQNSLADVPAEKLAGVSVRLHHYENAVWCWTRAVLNERYQDFDATASAVKRGEELNDASGDLWRDARWAISRVQDMPHCTVELI